MNRERFVIWVLRIGVIGTFLGHGINAIQCNNQWFQLFTSIGISIKYARFFLPIIGISDIIIAILIFVKPNRYILGFATIWCTITALSRVTAGLGILEFIERFSNICCPLSLLIYYRSAKNKQDQAPIHWHK